MKIPLQEDKNRMDKIFKITSILSKNHENTLVEILKVSCSLLGMEIGMIGKINNDDYFCLDYFSSSEGENLKNLTLNIKNTFCDITIKKNEVVTIDDSNLEEHKTHPCYEILKIRSYIGVPIKFNDQEIGTLSFSSYNSKEPSFTQTDRDLVQYLGQWVNSYFDRLDYKEAISKKNQELEKLNQELAINNQNLQKIMQEKNQLMQILVHDLKSPLSNIQMLSFLFQDFVTDKESGELLNIFNKSLQDVFHLIGQMETLNSVENFSSENFIEEFDLNTFLLENLKNFEVTAKTKQIEIIYSFDEEFKKIKTDQNFLKRILHNLISNALKFSAYDKNVFINLSNTKNEFQISIRDEGPGITIADQGKMFDRFSKLENKPTNNESSSGLGLFIVKELLNRINGTVSVKSNPDEGSIFTVNLPFELEKTI